MTTIRLETPLLEVMFGGIMDASEYNKENGFMKKIKYVMSFKVNSGKCVVLNALNNEANSQPYPCGILQKAEALKLLEFLKSIYEVEDER